MNKGEVFLKKGKGGIDIVAPGFNIFDAIRVADDIMKDEKRKIVFSLNGVEVVIEPRKSSYSYKKWSLSIYKRWLREQKKMIWGR